MIQRIARGIVAIRTFVAALTCTVYAASTSRCKEERSDIVTVRSTSERSGGLVKLRVNNVLHAVIQAYRSNARALCTNNIRRS
jgi:hypothetical protein